MCVIKGSIVIWTTYNVKKFDKHVTMQPAHNISTFIDYKLQSSSETRNFWNDNHCHENEILRNSESLTSHFSKYINHRHDYEVIELSIID